MSAGILFTGIGHARTRLSAPGRLDRLSRGPLARDEADGRGRSLADPCERQLAEKRWLLEELDDGNNSVLAALRLKPTSDAVTASGQLPQVPGAGFSTGDFTPDSPRATTFRPATRGLNSAPRFESDIRGLLHSRLRAVAVISTIGLGFFFLQYLAAPLRNTSTRKEWDWRDQGLLLLAIVVA